MAKKSPKPSIEEIEIPIAFQADGPTVFANQMMVQADEHECNLMFFDVQPPLLVGTPEEKKAALEQIGAIVAKRVVRVVISKSRLEIFARALQEIVDKQNPAHVNGKKSSK